MMQWTDNALILTAKAHSDYNAVVSILTENHGRHLGYVQGGLSSKKKADLEQGNHVQVDWSAKSSDQMGVFRIEPIENISVRLLYEPLRLYALQSACYFLDMTLAEREPHPALYHGTLALFDALQGDVWAESYIIWELSLLRELGFGLDLSRCAGGGAADDLAYVSPKTAVAVSREKGRPYADKLLPLPQFLLGQPDEDERQAITDGLKLTGYFLEHRVLAQTNYQRLPAARAELFSRQEG